MSLIISAVFDGPLFGGLPKGIELYVTADIPDLSIYGLGSANNGGGTDGEEFTFPAVSALAGDYIYIGSEAVGFADFFGFAPDYTANFANVNGDDAIELFQNGTVIDLLGDINVNGNGEVWEYLDGWAARNPGSTANGTFDPTQWTFSGANALAGATDNASAATPVPLAAFTNQPPARTITINEVDADNTGTDSAEFIELYDGGAGNTSLDGLNIVLFNGSSDTAYRTISLDGQTTDENGFFVIGSENVPNVDLDAFNTNGIQNGADAVALYEGTAPSAPTTDGLIDAVVYDTNDDDDDGLLAALGQTEQFNEAANGDATLDAIARDLDGVGSFVVQAPTPGETNFMEPPMPPTEVTLISTIQGAVGTEAGSQIGVDDVSLLDGQIVTVQAIVTADFQDGLFGSGGDRNGFYLQEEVTDYDFNDLTSEGIFIFDGSDPDVDVNVGDLVEVTGTVSEFNGQTQLSATTVAVLETDQLVPDAVDVTFPTATFALNGDGEYVANLEAYESMLVNVAQDMTVTELFNLDRFGEYGVTAGERPAQFSQTNEPDFDANQAYLQDVATRSVFIDDGSSAQNPAEIEVIDGNDGILTNTDSFRMGDTVSDITGVVTYGFDEFRIDNPTGTYTSANPRQEAPEALGGNFKVASLNVLNYFTTIDESGVTTDNGSDPRGADSPAEFERQAEKLVSAIIAMDANIVGLIELENDFAGDNFAIKDLVDRVNTELGSEVYAFVDPGQEFVGGDAISNGLIYKQDSVALQGDMAILESFEGRNFIDPLDAGRGLNRPAIAQTFEDLTSGETLTVSVNHLKSKGSLSGLAADEDQGDGQGNNNATRAEAADILGDWLNSDPTGQAAENVLILGDLNAYAQEDPLDELSADGYTDLAAQELGDDAYSFVFDGLIGTLDYALANDALASKVAGVTEWHINSDEADAFDYNLDFGRSPDLFDGDTAARNSDHDPVIVAFQFDPALNQIVGTNRLDFLVGTNEADEIDGLGGSDFILAKGGNDVIRGGDGNDKIIAGDGDDTIDGGSGREFILAGAGDDLINFGTGSGIAFGGRGADTYVISAEQTSDDQRDSLRIFDFDVTEDRIDLGGAGIERLNDSGSSTRITLDSGDRITLVGVRDADDIIFVGETAIV